MEFLKDNRIQVDPPKRPKKLTATRFASILGFNRWSTPFSAWCEMTRTYEEPFEDSIYTIAGKVIEPKICDYLRSRYFMDIKSPTDVYGPDYFKKTWGDFFPDVEGLGGMWDCLGDDFVVEVKTTKRVEDWRGSDGTVEPPIYYKLQACLYAYLLGFDNVVMTCSFLQDKDYEDPEAFVPTVDNTVVVEFSLSEEYPNFKEEFIDPAMRFWNDHVLTGISPEFDEKKDAEILKVLRKNVVETDKDLAKLMKEGDRLKAQIHVLTGISPEFDEKKDAEILKVLRKNVVETDKDLAKLMKEGDRLKAQIDKAEAKIADKKKRLKEIDDAVKKALIDQFRDGDKNVQATGVNYTWDVRRDVTKSFDRKKFDKDYPEVYDSYLTEKPKYVLTKKEIEKEIYL